MRLSVEWIKEWAPVEAEADDVAARLTMAGLEVEETGESEIGPVLDIKVTPNRGDCLSVVGVARELAAACSVPLKQPVAAPTSDPGRVPQWTSVQIIAPDLCPRYAARIVKNLRLGDSPAWMQERLIAAGMRPLNNLVDVTNYVMLETGQPLHAFDYDTLEERRIVVRRAREDETILTLDGTERELQPDMLVIADAEKPVAIAGVMGGADTEITAATRTMLLESAHFTPRTIRRTSRALGATDRGIVSFRARGRSDERSRGRGSSLRADNATRDRRRGTRRRRCLSGAGSGAVDLDPARTRDGDARIRGERGPDRRKPDAAWLEACW